MTLVPGQPFNFISYQSPHHPIHSSNTAPLLFLKHTKHTTPSGSLPCLKHSSLGLPHSLCSLSLCRPLLKCYTSVISSLSIHLKCHLFFCCFLREEGGGTEREKREKEKTSIVRLLIHTQSGHQTCSLGMCPDWELNLQPFGLQDNAPIN